MLCTITMYLGIKWLRSAVIMWICSLDGTSVTQNTVNNHNAGWHLLKETEKKYVERYFIYIYIQA